MIPSQYFDFLSTRVTSGVLNGFALLLSENDVSFFSLSFSSDLDLLMVKKIFQNLQIPDFRFVSVERLTFTFITEPLLFDNRYQIRFKMS